MVQRVGRASVSIAGALKSSIGNGLLVLLGVARDDGPDDVRHIAGKLARLRIFEDEGGLMNRSVQDVGGEILVVSQFTLLGDVRRGNRPGFGAAADPELAEKLYLEVVEELRTTGIKVATGEFGAMMDVELLNDGPVTIIIDSRPEQNIGNP